MIHKTVKKVILIAGGLYITYLVGVVTLAESIPYPTSQQLKEAEKVVERYVGENNGVKMIIHLAASQLRCSIVQFILKEFKRES